MVNFFNDGKNRGFFKEVSEFLPPCNVLSERFIENSFNNVLMKIQMQSKDSNLQSSESSIGQKVKKSKGHRTKGAR